VRRRIAEEMDRRGFTSPPHPSYRPRRASRTAGSIVLPSSGCQQSNDPALVALVAAPRCRLLRPAEPSRRLLYRPFLSLSLSLVWLGAIWGRGPEAEARFFSRFLDCAGTEEGDEGDGRKGWQESDENHRVYIQLIWSLLA